MQKETKIRLIRRPWHVFWSTSYLSIIICILIFVVYPIQGPMKILEGDALNKVFLLSILFLIALLVAFLLTKYIFQALYPMLAKSVSSGLPVRLSKGESWVFWMISYWSSMLFSGVLIGLLSAMLSHGNTVKGVGSLIVIMMILTAVAVMLSLPVSVYLRLKQLAKKQAK